MAEKSDEPVRRKKVFDPLGLVERDKSKDEYWGAAEVSGTTGGPIWAALAVAATAAWRRLKRLGTRAHRPNSSHRDASGG